MYPGFDADDMVKRGLFSSLMPFRRKSIRPQPEAARPPPPPPPPIIVHSHHAPHSQTIRVPLSPNIPPPQAVVHSIPREQLQPHYYGIERTQQDIFHEIVSECAQIERSNTTTPFSDTSYPTSPLTPLAPCPSPMVLSTSTQPIPSPISPVASPLQSHPLPVASPIMYTPMYDPMMPPQYAPPPYPGEECFVQPSPQHGYPIPPIMIAPSGDAQVPNAVLLEEVVKMVVSAMRQSSINDGQKESPEEILRRKRNQNNEAAARYRKRQRAARQRAEEELQELSRRNDELRNTVDHMENEIDQLKQLVLHSRMT